MSDDKRHILVRHYKFGMFVTVVLPAILVVGGFISLIIVGIIPYDPPQKECIASHITTEKILNANGKITFPEPREVCDVTHLYGKNGTFGYDYSYEIQQAYGKSFKIIKPSCDDVYFDDTAIFDVETMNFICADGTIAREYSGFG